MRSSDYTSQGAFRYFLSINAHSRILSKDSESGTSCIPLASLSEFVVCVCDTLEASRSMKDLLTRMGLSNVYVVICDIYKPAFKHGTFTHICMHDYALEKSDATENGNSPLEATVGLLKEDGEFYISRNYLESEGWLSRISDREPYKIPAQLKRYADIEHYKSLSSPWYVKFMRGSAYRSLKYKLRGNNTGAIYVKEKYTDAGRFRLIDQIQESIESHIDTKIDACNLVRIGSGSSLVADFQTLIARIPQSDEAVSRCKRNFAALKKLSNMQLPIRVPTPLCRGRFCNCFLTAEIKIEGTSLDNYTNLAEKYEDTIFRDAREFLVNSRLNLGVLDESLFNTLITEPILRLENTTETSNQDLFSRIIGLARNTLLNEEIPVVVEHGDFKYSNFLVDKARGTIIGIIDWDRSSLPGLPLRDYLSLLACRKNQSIQSTIDYMLNCSTLAEPEPIHRFYTDRIGISDESFAMLSLLAGIRTIVDFYDPPQGISFEFFEYAIRSHAIPALENNVM